MALTQGSVVFAGVGGALSENNANFFWDDSSIELQLGGTLAVTGHVTMEGVTSTGATGTGNLVFSAYPVMDNPTFNQVTYCTRPLVTNIAVHNFITGGSFKWAFGMQNSTENFSIRRLHGGVNIDELVIDANGAGTNILNTLTLATPATSAGSYNLLTLNTSTNAVEMITGSGAITTMAAIGSSPNANGATISGGTLTLQPASGSFGGVVTNGAQTIAGDKTWTGQHLFDGTTSLSVGYTVEMKGRANGSTVLHIESGPSGNDFIYCTAAGSPRLRLTGGGAIKVYGTVDLLFTNLGTASLNYLGSNGASGAILNSPTGASVILGVNNTAVLTASGSSVTLAQALSGISASFSSTIKMGSFTVAGLPAAGTTGRMAYVTDANAPTFLAVVTGGGSTITPVFDNGTNWIAF